jgi:hypothetical protein
MNKSKIVLHSLGHALGVLLYISLVVTLITNLEKYFANTPDTFMAPIAMLLLLVLSVAVMAVLVFGRPVYLFLNNAKQEAYLFLGYTLGWLFLLVIIAFIVIFLITGS